MLTMMTDNDDDEYNDYDVVNFWRRSMMMLSVIPFGGGEYVLPGGL